MPKPSLCFLETAFFSDEKIFKVTQLLNVQNDRTYAPSAYKKSTIENKRLYVERSGFPICLVVSVAVSKVGKSSISFVEPGAKVNGAYYREKLLAPIIREMDRLTGYQPYVFMQDGARSYTVRFLNQQQYLTLLQPNMWPPNNPDLNPVNYCYWSALERNVYRGRRFENTIELKEAILQEWEALPQAVINNAIDGFRSRVRLVIAENGQHIEKYWSNEQSIAYYLCRVNFYAIAVCDTHYLNTGNFVILWKILIIFYTATQYIVVKKL